jgi:hypothetical protein
MKSKKALVIVLIFLLPLIVWAQVRRFARTTFADLGSPPNDSVRYCTDCTANSNPCTSGGSGAVAFRINGAWNCSLSGGGGGSGDVAGPSASTDSELPLFSSTTGKLLKRSNTFNGFAFLTSGVVSGIGSSGTGAVVRDSSPTIVTPTIASFANATHSHQNAAGGGTLDAAAIAAGALAKARQHAATVYNDQANTFSTGAQDLSAAIVELPNGTTPTAGDCDAAGEAGRIFIDTDATTGRRVYVCEGAGGWVLQGDGGGVGGSDTQAQFNQAGVLQGTSGLTATTTQVTLIKPILGGNAGLPGTCAVGEMIRNTSDSNRSYLCHATNTWGEIFLAGLSGPISVPNGGTGLGTLTANNVILGNGTSAPTFVAPSTNGNVLTSNGTTWTSAAPTGGSSSLLDVQNNLSNVVVDTTDVTLFTYSLASLAAGKCIEVKYVVLDTGQGDTVTTKFHFGATSITNVASDTASQRFGSFTVCNDPASQTAQSIYGAEMFNAAGYHFGAGGNTNYHVRGAVTTSSAVTVKVTGTRASGTVNVTPLAWMVRKID